MFVTVFGEVKFDWGQKNLDIFIAGKTKACCLC